MTIIPEDIKTEEDGGRGFFWDSEDLAKEEVANWTAPEFEDADEEDLEEELEWEDEEEEWDDEDDSDEDEEDEDES